MVADATVLPRTRIEIPETNRNLAVLPQPPLRLCRLPGDTNQQEAIMGRGILLWLLGIPIPIIILLALIWR